MVGCFNPQPPVPSKVEQEDSTGDDTTRTLDYINVFHTLPNDRYEPDFEAVYRRDLHDYEDGVLVAKYENITEGDMNPEYIVASEYTTLVRNDEGHIETMTLSSSDTYQVREFFYGSDDCLDYSETYLNGELIETRYYATLPNCDILYESIDTNLDFITDVTYTRAYDDGGRIVSRESSFTPSEGAPYNTIAWAMELDLLSTYYVNKPNEPNETITYLYGVGKDSLPYYIKRDIDSDGSTDMVTYYEHFEDSDFEIMTNYNSSRQISDHISTMIIFQRVYK
jgi:hypothetical protein